MARGKAGRQKPVGLAEVDAIKALGTGDAIDSKAGLNSVAWG